jgi:hypothetical protein
MITMPDLQTSLLDLLFEIEGTDIKLIIGGGFGIYLKIDYVQQLGKRGHSFRMEGRNPFIVRRF